jgi:Na+-translocating ferredoxin:NAD+ oxidoreductase RnfD subunit
VPKTLLGKLIYGITAGAITILYWKYGKNPDLGAFYAVLIVGIVANAIKGFYRPRIVGEKK